ncbi:MAG: thiamine-monophosphate kinase [Planctomycetes bacterium]|nr:thiamine-monophosphate kinase [Planctomycetota bacterium]
MGELALIRRIREAPTGHPWLKVGPGSDCAVVTWPAGHEMAYKIDQVVEGAHFVLDGPEAATPRQIGWKALAKAASDIAAAGCRPVAALVAINLRNGLDDTFALELHAGVKACAERLGFALAGGDITSSERTLTVCVSLIGAAPAGQPAWLRQGARAGDVLLVTGELGGSRGGKHLDFMPRVEEASQLRNLAGAGIRACIDITDGLARDAGHLCEESGVGIEIDEAALPLSAAAVSAAGRDGRSALEHVLGDGEDFELLLAVDPSAAEALMKNWAHATRLTRIGRVLPPAAGRTLKRSDGRSERLPDVGYEHGTSAGSPTQ